MNDTVAGHDEGPAETDVVWPPTVTPYLVVADARRAVHWYGQVFNARLRGEPHLMSDGSIGHTELAIGSAVLMLTEGGRQTALQPPRPGNAVSHSVHLLVSDIDATLERARELGARIEQEPVDRLWGRTGTIVDPFGHRWMLNEPPA